MPPLMLLAATLLPEILKIFATDKTGTVGEKVAGAFKDVFKTEDKATIEKELAASDTSKAEVQLKLAQIAADVAEERHRAEEAERRFELEVLQDQLAESERMREAEFRRFDLDARDREQARERQTRLEQSDSVFAYVAPTLALIITIGLGYFMYMLITTHSELQNKDVFNTILGAVTTSFVTIVTFYFGSSIGSKDKDQMITSGKLVPSDNSSSPGYNPPDSRPPIGEPIGSGSGKSNSPSLTPSPKKLAPPRGPYALFRQKAPGIMRLLMKDFGLADFQAAGVLGNLGHECGGFRMLQEGRPLSGRGGWGWAQWTGTRRKAFEEWANSIQLNFSSDEANYGFLRIELNGDEGRKVIGPLKRSSDIDSATRVFMDNFERPHKDYQHFTSRKNYANIALEEYRRA